MWAEDRQMVVLCIYFSKLDLFLCYILYTCCNWHNNHTVIHLKPGNQVSSSIWEKQRRCFNYGKFMCNDKFLHNAFICSQNSKIFTFDKKCHDGVFQVIQVYWSDIFPSKEILLFTGLTTCFRPIKTIKISWMCAH